ncbi:hypothetical protein AMTRI_Chr11g94780 [Amborella trichopoda]|uniref:non-specific serine/threonine protein kinase n=1 Tax=Amborella trichopoda TaxID=13333 RepID=U5D1E3_AMBTC|nr:serine/threonine-protein kinase STY46 [Amborella trichopoda]ERN16030.1 hypothetical protein AMTR_s00030p00101370 [Amborella trichopoda]|eukprot:XP_006854563.1 serine/threonine-protein kinase STY46 [Amborella trichopoda]
MELLEGVGESPSPPRGFAVSQYEVWNDVYDRLVGSCHEEAAAPDFREQIEAHFNRLPPSYGFDVNLEKVEDVLLHRKILQLAKIPEMRPVFHVRFMESILTRIDGDDDPHRSKNCTSLSRGCHAEHRKDILLDNRDSENEIEPLSKLEGLNLDSRKNANDSEEQSIMAASGSQELSWVPLHEIIFSTIDKPKLLSQLSALLSDMGLNIREAHVFSTNDGYSLDVFVVDGWPSEDTDGLHKALDKAIAGSEAAWSGSSPSHSVVDRIQRGIPNLGDWEIDQRFLKMGEKIASGSCGDLYHGTYLGQDVAIKTIRAENLSEALEVEFAQEVAILREVQHRNVVRFVGACTKPPQLCIVTEFMSGGSLYDFLHKHQNILELSFLLKFAIDVCKGMEYLHRTDVIHRDLKTANLLMDSDNVVKVADFGVARFQNQGGTMTAETGTYRWMAPEVINHQPYDQKADVFSFGIVLWELATSKVPYDNLTPLQAALGVREGMRPSLPENAHPRLLALMQRCWNGDPRERPSFLEIGIELEDLVQEMTKDTAKK